VGEEASKPNLKLGPFTCVNIILIKNTIICVINIIIFIIIQIIIIMCCNHLWNSSYSYLCYKYYYFYYNSKYSYKK
jgi:hypothetical protein